MNLFDLSPEQLKRAASIKEQIDGLNKQLRGILGVPATSRVAPTRNRTMSPSVKKKIAATQKARWAKVRSSKPATVSPQTRGQKDRIQYGYLSEVVGEIESVLGGEEKTRQEVIPRVEFSAHSLSQVTGIRPLAVNSLFRERN